MRGSKSRINCFEKVHEVKVSLDKNSPSKPEAFVVQLAKDFWKGCLLSDCAVSRTRVVADGLIGNRACDTKGRRTQPCDPEDPMRSSSGDRVWWGLFFFVLVCCGVLILASSA
jgi:hypothetical protein